MPWLAAVALNNDYYSTLRAAAGVRGVTVPVVSPADPAYVDATMRWAMSPAAGTPDGAAVRTIGMAQKLVANAGRRQVFAGMEADRIRSGKFTG